MGVLGAQSPHPFVLGLFRFSNSRVPSGRLTAAVLPIRQCGLRPLVPSPPRPSRLAAHLRLRSRASYPAPRGSLRVRLLSVRQRRCVGGKDASLTAPFAEGTRVESCPLVLIRGPGAPGTGPWADLRPCETLASTGSPGTPCLASAPRSGQLRGRRGCWCSVKARETPISFPWLLVSPPEKSVF